MKIVFISNFYNHHQAPFSQKLRELLGDNYFFIQTATVDQERIDLGYQQFSESFVLQYANNSAKCDQLIQCADVVIWGSAPRKLIYNRLREGKLVFLYSERIYKILPKWFEMPARTIKYYWEKGKYKNMYLLCSSAFTAADYAKTKTFQNKAYKWGYFPQKKEYKMKVLMERKDKHRILWVGRFLNWKHPDDALSVAKRLKDAGYHFLLEMCGTGELDEQLKTIVHTLQIEDCVIFRGAIPSNEVRNYMEHAGIYLFTSDRYEGWGAVLNESMNSGCAVVASHAIGAVPYLMEHQVNGLIYQSENVDDLYEKVKYLLDNPKEQERLGRGAYETIVGEWNAEIAAERLVALSQSILDGEKQLDLFETGPCSRAEIISDEWFSNDVM